MPYRSCVAVQRIYSRYFLPHLRGRQTPRARTKTRSRTERTRQAANIRLVVGQMADSGRTLTTMVQEGVSLALEFVFSGQ